MQQTDEKNEEDEEDEQDEDKEEEEEQPFEISNQHDNDTLTVKDIINIMKPISRNKDNGDNYPILTSTLVSPDASTSAVQAKKTRNKFYKKLNQQIQESKKKLPTQQVTPVLATNIPLKTFQKLRKKGCYTEEIIAFADQHKTISSFIRPIKKLFKKRKQQKQKYTDICFKLSYLHLLYI